MPSPFETAPATPAIPITFATKTTWSAIARELPEQARQFALANDFTAKPGKCLTLPTPDGQIAQVVFGLEDEIATVRDAKPTVWMWSEVPCHVVKRSTG